MMKAGISKIVIYTLTKTNAKNRVSRKIDVGVFITCIPSFDMVLAFAYLK